MEQLNKEIKAFVNEQNRLMKKYGFEESANMTVADFWKQNYVEDELDMVEYYGGKNYAQFELHNGGIIPASEVDAWK